MHPLEHFWITRFRWQLNILFNPKILIKGLKHYMNRGRIYPAGLILLLD